VGLKNSLFLAPPHSDAKLAPAGDKCLHPSAQPLQSFESSRDLLVQARLTAVRIDGRSSFNGDSPQRCSALRAGISSSFLVTRKTPLAHE